MGKINTKLSCKAYKSHNEQRKVKCPKRKDNKYTHKIQKNHGVSHDRKT